MKYIRYVKSQCPGVLGGMYFWMYFLYLMHFLYKTETRNLFLMQEVFQMEGIEKVCQFLDEAHVYYLATVEGSNPGVVRLAHRCCMMESFIFRPVR